MTKIKLTTGEELFVDMSPEEMRTYLSSASGIQVITAFMTEAKKQTVYVNLRAIAYVFA